MTYRLSLEAETRETGVGAGGTIMRELTGKKTAHLNGIRIPIWLANLLWRAIRWRTR